MSSPKRLLAGVLVLLGATGQLWAEGVQASADVAIASRYVFRGETGDGAALQPGLNIWAEGWSGGVWMSQSLERSDPAEVDFYGSYEWSLNASSRLALGATAYHHAPADRAGGRNDSVEPYVTLSTVTASGMAPGATIYYNAARKAWTGQVQTAYALPLATWGAALDFGGSIGRTWAERRDGGSHTFGSAGVTLRYQVMRAALSVGWQLATARRGTEWGTAGVWTTGFRYTF